MTKPIPDKAEVVLEYPEKFYAGTFERSARFDARFDDRGISLLLDHPGDADTRKSVHLHLHYALFADILRDLTRTAAAIPADHARHRGELGDAANALHAALAAAGADCICRRAVKGRTPTDDASKMTAEEEVLLLHVLE
jgi:hypothetical protein